MTIPVLAVQGSAERAGAERMLFNLLKYLDRSVFTPSVAFFADGPFIQEIEGLGVHVERFPPAARVREVTRWGKTISGIQSAAKRTEASVVIANGERMSVFTGRAARRIGVPSVAWLHDAPGSRGRAGKSVQWLLARTPQSAVVTCSSWLAEDFNRKLNLGAFCIPNGLDLSDLPSADPASVRAEIGWPGDAFIYAHFGRLERWKGADVFIRAASEIAAEHRDVRFLVVGDTLYGRDAGFFDELRALADERGLGDRLKFLGYRADSLSVMSAVDAVVHCSLEPDPFPTVILEGMALGKLVIATTTRGPEEALVQGRTGLLVPPADPGALAGSMRWVLEHRAEAAAVASEAKIDAHARFDARRMAREFGGLFQRLAGGEDLPSNPTVQQRTPR